MKNSIKYLSPFIRGAILDLYEDFRQGNKPLDLLLNQYFKRRRLGARDRKIVGEHLYTMVRYLSLVQSQGRTPEAHLAAVFSLEELKKKSSLHEAVRLGVPSFFLAKLKQEYGKEKAYALCQILCEQAPVTIRINPLKTSREELLERWGDSLGAKAAKKSPLGIQFPKRLPLFSYPEFKQGFFEMQDEGSQCVADLIEAAPENLVLDYCSGSGGKTLAFAHKMQGKGQIFLHDTRASALIEAKKRLKRAGIQNAQYLSPDHPTLSRLKKRCDFVLVDVPCSGSGTLRRNVEQKWKLGALFLKEMVQKQREIFEKALSFVKPGGKILYVTCSLLSEENENQIDFFLKTHPIQSLQSPWKILPTSNGPDGFFAALFEKN